MKDYSFGILILFSRRQAMSILETPQDFPNAVKCPCQSGPRASENLGDFATLANLRYPPAVLHPILPGHPLNVQYCADEALLPAATSSSKRRYLSSYLSRCHMGLVPGAPYHRSTFDQELKTAQQVLETSGNILQ